MLPRGCGFVLSIIFLAFLVTTQSRSIAASAESHGDIEDAGPTWSWQSFLSPRSLFLPRRQLTTDAQGNVGYAFAQPTVSCSDGQTNQENGCWSQLSLSKYVVDWVSKNKCGSEGFARCFLKANGFSGLDCGTVNNQNCVSPQPGKWGPNVFYVIYAMYSLNQYFSDYWNLVSPALASAKSTSTNMNAMFNLTDNATLTAQISTDTDLLSDQIKSQINDTLVSIERNVTQLIQFAELGKFTTRKKLPPNAGTVIQRIFSTYQTSLALNRSNIVAVAAKDTNPNQLATNGTKLAYPLDDCKAGYDTNGLCDAWYFSRNTSTAYALNSLTNITIDYGSAISSLFQNITTGNALFEDAASCRANNQALSVSIDWTGLTVRCASQLNVYEWAKQCDDKDKGCEFANGVPNQDGFWQLTSASEDSEKHVVPPGYLGPEIVTGDGTVSIIRELGKGNTTVAASSLQAGENRTLSEGG